MGAVTQQEFEQMAATYQEQANRGNVASMKLLGDMYYQGPSGTERNVAAALPWWKMAAEHGERSLASKVGYAYFKGDGCEKDEKLALYYYHMAADYTDDAQSEYTVGLFYENGIGCHANKRKALPYYERAALRGHAEAQWRLGALLFASQKNDGLHWLCCAHLSGVQDATDMLNHFISNGHGNVVQSELNEIKRYGIDRYGRQHEYNPELSIFLSVLKWLAIGFVPSLLFITIVCGFILHMESWFFPNILFVLLIGLFGYFGYWWEAN